MFPSCIERISRIVLTLCSAQSKVKFPILGDHSTLLVSFHLKRHMGDFVIQVFGNIFIENIL